MIKLWEGGREGGNVWNIKYKDHINQIGIYADNLATLPLLAQFYGSVLASDLIFRETKLESDLRTQTTK